MLFQSLSSTAERVFVDFVLGPRSAYNVRVRSMQHAAKLTLIWFGVSDMKIAELFQKLEAVTR